jgi:hypothetical protein
MCVQPLPPLTAASRGPGIILKIFGGEQYCSVQHFSEISEPAAENEGKGGGGEAGGVLGGVEKAVRASQHTHTVDKENDALVQAPAPIAQY